MQNTAYIAKDQRFKSLDALRGGAALAVMLAHSLNYFPDSKFSTTLNYSFVEAARILLNGSVAVSVFFVISGFVLSFHYFSYKKTVDHLAVDIAHRTPRLFIPVLLTGIPCVFLQYYTNIVFSPLDLNQFEKSIWLSNWTVDNWSIIQTIDFFLFHVFAFYDSNVSFNVNLWTMKIEYTFSFLVFFICGWYLRVQRHLIFLIPIVLILLFTWESLDLGFGGELLSLTDFIFGVVIAWTMVNVELFRSLLSKLNRPLVLLIGLALCALTNHFGAGTLLLFILNKVSVLLLFIFSLSYSITLNNEKQSKWLNVLGDISFPLYLIHGSILYFVFTGISHYESNLSTIGFYIGIVLSMLITLVISLLFIKYIEKPILIYTKRKTISLLQ